VRVATVVKSIRCRRCCRTPSLSSMVARSRRPNSTRLVRSDATLRLIVTLAERYINAEMKQVAGVTPSVDFEV
jgi:hypothetical protein